MDVLVKNNKIAMGAYQNRLRKGKNKSGLSANNANTEDTYDNVRFSEHVKELSELKSLIKTLPDVNDKRVSDVQLEIEKGQYSVQGQTIAYNMLHNAFENNFILDRMVAYA